MNELGGDTESPVNHSGEEDQSQALSRASVVISDLPRLNLLPPLAFPVFKAPSKEKDARACLLIFVAESIRLYSCNDPLCSITSWRAKHRLTGSCGKVLTTRQSRILFSFPCCLQIISLYATLSCIKVAQNFLASHFHHLQMRPQKLLCREETLAPSQSQQLSCCCFRCCIIR